MGERLGGKEGSEETGPWPVGHVGGLSSGCGGEAARRVLSSDIFTTG